MRVVEGEKAKRSASHKVVKVSTYPGNKDTKRGGKKKKGPGIPEGLEGVCRIRKAEKKFEGQAENTKGEERDIKPHDC